LPLSFNNRVEIKTKMRRERLSKINRLGFQIGLILIAISIFGSFGIAFASFNEQINYQGKLMDSGGVAVADGNKCMRFSLYTVSTGGSPIWTEEWKASTSYVVTSNGLFSVLLGSHSSLSNVDFNQSSLYLQVDYDPGCDDTYEEVFSPRKRLGAVPAAFEAKKLEGYNWASPGALGSSTPNTGAFTTLSASGNVTFDGGTFVFNESGADKDFRIEGEGSPNLFFADASANSVGIGTNTPSSILEIDSNGLTNYFSITNLSSGDILTVDSAGNVGIGTTTPNNKFQVSELIDFDDTDFNILLGTQAGYSDAGRFNIFVGYQAGYNNDTTGTGDEGERNIYIGYKSGYGETAGTQNTGYSNIGLGYATLRYNTSGSRNVAVGDYSLYLNTSGHRNTAVGAYALKGNSTGYRNVAVGTDALISVDASNNTAVGDAAGYYLSSGADNTLIGRAAMFYNETGSNNVVVGSFAGFGQSGNNQANNVYIGVEAGKNNIGSGNVLIGYQAGYNETGSNKLYIENSNSATPLIYGEFDNDIVTINGTLGIADTSPDYPLEILSTTTPQFAISYTDAAYSTFEVDSGGDLTITPSGGDILLPSNTTIGSASEGDIYFFDGDTSGENYELRIYGYITATSGPSFAALNLDDANDEFLIDVSDGDADTTLDAAIRLDDISGSSVFRIRDSGGTEVFRVDSDGYITMVGSTAKTLVTRVSAGAPSESDADGALVIDSTNGRIYYRYGGAWHYSAQTAGFTVPAEEKTDTISGEPIQEGDFVLGLINDSFEDGSLHGIWVKWDNVKQELLEEIYAQLGIVSTDSNSASEGLILDEDGSVLSNTYKSSEETWGTEILGSYVEKIKQALASLGLTIEKGIAQIKEIITDRLTAKTVRVEKIEMVDAVTGEIYCTWIERGKLKKVKAKCDQIEYLNGQMIVSDLVPEHCDAQHLNLCTNQELCLGANLHWYNGKCNLEPKEDVKGCTDPEAINYNQEATVDDGSCQYPIEGCTDSTAINYNPEATIDDGSCEYPPAEIKGCTDAEAMNYNPEATIDDGSCQYPESEQPTEVEGCTDPKALNYNPEATIDDSSCQYPEPEPTPEVEGCTDPEALNYNPEATIDDGSCEYPVKGCTDPEAINYNQEATVDDGSCQYPIEGCTDSTAINYNPEATIDDGSCRYEILGCMDPEALNYDPKATKEDGSCQYFEVNPLPIDETVDEISASGETIVSQDSEALTQP